MSTPVALLTGAGSGIGRAAAAELDARGFRLALVGRRREPLEETAALLKNESACFPADVGCADQCHELVASVLGRFARVDALINNAAIAPCKPISEHTPELIEEVFSTNALGPARLISLLWPIFVSQGSGRIINLSSVTTTDPYPGLLAYAASKAALELMVKSCVNEAEGTGIKAIAIAPGAVETEMLRGVVGPKRFDEIDKLDPKMVAGVIADAATGKLDDRNGEVVYLRNS